MNVRVVHGKIDDMQPGDIAFLNDRASSSISVLMCCPECKWPHGLRTHKVTIHDYKITIDPSIVCGNAPGGKPCTGHYWVKNSQVIPA